MAVRDLLERRRLRQAGEPAERIELLVFPLLRDATARDAVETIAAGNEVAVELPRFAAVRETDGPVEQLHIGSLGDDLRAAPVSRGKQVLLQARLPIGDEALAAVPVDVDEEAPAPGPDDAHAVVHMAPAIQARGGAVPAPHLDPGRPPHPGADCPQHVAAALPPEHHALDAMRM